MTKSISTGVTVKLRQSCESCAWAKVRCGKEKPSCVRCLERGMDCMYGASKRTGRCSSQNKPDANRTKNEKAKGRHSPYMIKRRHDSLNLDDQFLSLVSDQPGRLSNDLAVTATRPNSGRTTSQTQPVLDTWGPATLPFDDDGIFAVEQDDLDDFVRQSCFGQGQQTLPRGTLGSSSQTSDTCCLTIALDLLGKSSIKNPSTSCPRQSGWTSDTSEITLEQAIALNKQIIGPLSDILDCTCAPNENLLMILKLVIFNIISWCARAVSNTPRSTPANIMSGGPSFLVEMLSCSTSNLQSRESGQSGLSGGAAMQTHMAAYAILDDLYRVQDVVDRFGVRVQATETRATADSADIVFGYGRAEEAANIEECLGSTPLPLLNASSMQAEIRRRLRAVSFGVVKILLSR